MKNNEKAEKLVSSLIGEEGPEYRGPDGQRLSSQDPGAPEEDGNNVSPELESLVGNINALIDQVAAYDPKNEDESEYIFNFWENIGDMGRDSSVKDLISRATS